MTSHFWTMSFILATSMLFCGLCQGPEGISRSDCSCPATPPHHFTHPARGLGPPTGAITPCPSDATAVPLSSSRQSCPVWPWAPLSWAHTPPWARPVAILLEMSDAWAGASSVPLGCPTSGVGDRLWDRSWLPGPAVVEPWRLPDTPSATAPWSCWPCCALTLTVDLLKY